MLGMLWLGLAGAIVAVAVLSALARVALPYADALRPDLERWLAQALDRPVSIGRISAGLSGLGPEFSVEDVRLGEGDSAAHIERAEVAIDVVRSLLRGAPYAQRLELAGLRIEVVRESDGTVSVAGLPLLQGAHDAGDAPRAWFVPQGRMKISDADLVVIDRAAAEGERAWRLTGVEGEVRSAAGRFQAQGSATPDPELGARVGFAIDVNGTSPAGRVTELYLEVDGLRPTGILAGRAFGGIVVQDGRLDGRAWFVWRGGVLRSVEGEARADGLAIAAAGQALLTTDPEGPPEATPVTPSQVPSPALVERVGGRFTWRSKGPGWRLDVDRLVLGGDNPGDESRRLAIARAVDGAPPGGIVARLEAARLEALLPVLALSAPAPVAGALAGLNPAGLVRDVEVRYHAGEDGAPDFSLRARFEDVSSEAWSGVPGLSDIGGELRMDEREGALTLEAGPGSSPSFERLFRDALPVSSFAARLEWGRDEGAWRVRIPRVSLRNEDLALRARARLDWPLVEGGEPEIALYADFEAESVGNVSRYLPALIMPQGAVRWLDHAIVAGRVPRGEVTWHGPLRGFPYDEHHGQFRVAFDLREGELAYADGWPVIGGIDARVVFEGRRMAIAAERARMLATAIGPTRVTIDDLTAAPAVLVVDGRTRGPVEDVLRILRETPLAERYGRYAEGAAGEGEGELALHLELPLGQPPRSVEGALDFERGLLRIGDGFELAEIDGRLHFSGDGLEGRAIRARVLGLPALIDVHPAREEGVAARIEGRGTADATAIAGLIGVPPAWLDGETAWQARLAIPAGDAFTGDGLVLRVGSTLENLVVRLPEPLGKSAGEARALEVTMGLPRGPHRPVSARLGDRAALALAFDEGGTRIARAELRFGGEPAVLPAEGVRIAGRLERADLAEWRSALQAGVDDGAGELAVREVDLEIVSARALGRGVNDVRIAAGALDDGAWTIDVDSRELNGRIEAPARQGLPWRANLEYLHLTAPDSDGAAPVDPRTLPPVRVTSGRFTYDDIDFGRLELRATPATAGMRLDELKLDSPVMRVDARGDWVLVDDEQYSSFNIEFAAHDVGRALAGLGYAGTIRGGKGSSTIVARWRGPPTAFSLDRLSGSMTMSITDGRLLDVEPGAGRIFGLVSLQALPRRLTLDFSDFFGKGFGFDRIDGTFEIRDGVAHTGDLTMVGPAARVAAEGVVDLAARRYDQTITVVPSVGAGLPVAGVVAGGVGIGAAMLLMERVFKDDIERITRMRYRVTGPWEDPLVERVQDAAQPEKR